MRVTPIEAIPYGPAVFYGSLFAIFVLDKARTSGPAPEGEIQRDEGTSQLIRRLGFLALVVAISIAYALPKATLPLDPTVALFAGVAVQWAGFGLVLWTTRILGALYRPVIAVQQGHRVIRSGPYRLVRHQMYAGGLLTDVGVGLALANVISIVVLLGLGSYAYVRRIAAEERLLSERLGEEYEQYARTTKRLIPFVW